MNIRRVAPAAVAALAILVAVAPAANADNLDNLTPTNAVQAIAAVASSSLAQTAQSSSGDDSLDSTPIDPNAPAATGNATAVPAAVSISTAADASVSLTPASTTVPSAFATADPSADATADPGASAIADPGADSSASATADPGADATADPGASAIADPGGDSSASATADPSTDTSNQVVQAPLPTLTVQPEGVSATADVVSGLAVRSQGDGVSSVAQPTTSGARFYTVIASSMAASDFRYDLAATEIPAGADSASTGAPVDLAGQTLGDGSIVLTDPAGTVVTTIAAPWARDATGASVPTTYTLNGDVLTQHVDLSNASISYPVVADPSFSFTINLTVNNYSLKIGHFGITWLGSYAWKENAATVMKELHRCFNCSFPILNAPKKFPTVGQTIHLNGNTATGSPDIPAPVRVTKVGSTSWGFVALPGHFDGAGSTIDFQFYNSKDGSLHLIVDSYIKNGHLGESLVYPSVARLQWQPLINKAAWNAYYDYN